MGFGTRIKSGESFDLIWVFGLSMAIWLDSAP